MPLPVLHVEVEDSMKEVDVLQGGSSAVVYVVVKVSVLVTISPTESVQLVDVVEDESHELVVLQVSL